MEDFCFLAKGSSLCVCVRACVCVCVCVCTHMSTYTRGRQRQIKQASKGDLHLASCLLLLVSQVQERCNAK
jgi:hypothetical protein